ncbi:MAG: beta-ketoacyl-ACP synthase II [Chloroflexi bacterium]|nr:beta-ketoacyl-ACP synthase II [Chloroflexota bacterium]
MMMGSSERVVVTGLGAITPLGNSVDMTWAGLVEGQSGAGPITAFDASEMDARIAAEVKDFNPEELLSHREARRLDRFCQFALVAAREAIADAGLTIDEANAEDVGVLMGSGIGGINTLADQIDVLQTKGPHRVSPFLIPMFIIDLAAGQVAIATGARGPNFGTVSACASSGHALGEAAEIIRRGDAKAMIAGGSEAGVLPIGIAGFAAMRALSTRNDEPERASRPFDRDRDGFVMGEGGGAVILEAESYARARGARIYAELAGYAATDDAYHITAPSEGGEGAARAMRIALRKAECAPADIDYINAHGTSTPANDRLETTAIKAVFGQCAYGIPVSSTKSMTGHLLGGAGAVEAIVCVKAIEEGIVPPTINYDNPDPDCDLDYVPNAARTCPVRVSLSNSLGFGGHNVTLIFRRYQG